MKNLLFYSIKWLLWGWYKSYMNLKITREGLLAKYPWIEQMYHDIKSARARQKFRLVLPICCFRKSSFFFLINAYDQSFVKFLWSEICFFVTFISILQETRLKWHYKRRHESLLRGEKIDKIDLVDVVRSITTYWRRRTNRNAIVTLCGVCERPLGV